MNRRSVPISAVFAVLTVLAAACSPSEAPSGSTASSESATTSAASPAPSPTTGPPVATPVVADVVAAPVPVPGTDGKVHLAYELKLTNVLDQEVTLTSVAVREGDRTLLELSGDRLPYWTRIIGTPSPATKLGPAQTAIVWLDVALDKDAAMPTALLHTVGISVPKPIPPLFPATMTEVVAPVTVQTRKPVVISPPLSGPGWLDGNGCCDMGAHRMALNPIDGGLWAAERFAIDYVQLGADGLLFTGDQTKVDSYPYFGADIHAVADGPVVGAVDGLPEQVPGKSPTGLALNEYAGNHIVQDLGDGNYALYAHIKTGAVKVKPGDQLTAGQVIGSVGNTGNTDAPHLHFHVMSTPDPLRSDGLPFVFTSFTLDSRVINADALGPLLDGEQASMQPGVAKRDETKVIPMDLDVMTYETK
ncbi:M23 family metallopeptidase [Mycolicibacterium stellerae]|uniref:M23 family metallopeptidase n=1 Tax=Mycolicibacterium stellerae TaxID=2358193 RepID=UPI001F38DDE1|nr:M23 family metallopeptidase [Mycolicibacterium stellerae]